MAIHIKHVAQRWAQRKGPDIPCDRKSEKVGEQHRGERRLGEEVGSWRNGRGSQAPLWDTFGTRFVLRPTWRHFPLAGRKLIQLKTHNTVCREIGVPFRLLNALDLNPRDCVTLGAVAERAPLGCSFSCWMVITPRTLSSGSIGQNFHSSIDTVGLVPVVAAPVVRKLQLRRHPLGGLFGRPSTQSFRFSRSGLDPRICFLFGSQVRLLSPLARGPPSECRCVS